MNKIRTGWRIAKQCFAVLRSDTELLVFPLLSTIALALVAASFVAPLWFSGRLEAAADDPGLMQQPLMLAYYFVFYLVNYFVITFFNSALVACAIIRFRGGDPTVKDGLHAASQRLPAIFGWALVSAVVGTLLQSLEQRSGIIGRLVIGVIGVSWAIASYFAVPVIVIENAGPLQALKRSASIIKGTWGEALVAQGGLSILTFAAALLGAAAIGFGAAMLHTSPLLGATLIGTGVVWMFVVVLTVATLRAILTSALYLYAADGKVPQSFDNQLLHDVFASNPRT